MPGCRRCAALLLVAAVCRVAAAGTEGPDVTGDNITEAGGVLDDATSQEKAGAATPEPLPGDYTSSPPGDYTSSPPGDYTSSPPGDYTSSPPGDYTSSPPGDYTSSPPGDYTSSPPGDYTSSPPGAGTPSASSESPAGGATSEPLPGNYTSSPPGDFTSSPPGAGTPSASSESPAGGATSEPLPGNYTSSPPGDFTSSPPGAGTRSASSESPAGAGTTAGPPATTEAPLSTDLPRSIPPLVTPVGSLCVCDLLVGECDVNCCCDADCSAADFSVFSECSIPVVTGDSQQCKREAVLYSISTSKVPQRVTETVEVVNPNIFCIQATNYLPALSFITPNEPTEANFESLLTEFGGMSFNSESDTQSTVGSAEARLASKYEYGSPILTRDSYLKLPSPLGTSDCTDSNPVGFLKNQDFTCSRTVEIQNCSIPALTLETYTNLEVLPVPSSQNTINVTLQAITIKSVDGAVFHGNPSDYIPSYDITTGICNNVVLGGSYTFSYTDKGEITSIAALFNLGAIDKNTVQQNFQLHFIEVYKCVQQASDRQVSNVQADSKEPFTLNNYLSDSHRITGSSFMNGTAPTPLSGNPGYVFGLPVVAGFKLSQSGIIQSTNRFGQLTLLKSSNDQNCLAEEGNRTPVLFGYNMMSGCRLRLNYTGTNFCKLTRSAVLNVLQGQQFPNYVAQFGNSQPQNLLDWLPINIINTEQPEVQALCRIPISLNLEVKWTKFGSLVNAQAQIVNVEQNIAYASFPNNLDGTRFLQISSSVTFLDVSQPASPGYKAQPTIDAKLPFDFFHPFL